MDFIYPAGATPLSPEEQDGLKLKHIKTREELDRWEQDNIQDALAWLDRRKKSNILDEDFVRLLHKKMFGKAWQWAGDFRRSDKNIGVAWTHVQIELRNLLNDVKAWIEHQSYTPDEICYRLHHRLVQIHLFANGNGRHSRLITDIILIEMFNQKPFSWGSGNLSAANDVRMRYITALKTADRNDYGLLHDFVWS